MDISIDGVIRVTISEIEEYEPDDDEDEEDNEPYYRTMTIETESGVIEIELNGSSEEALEVIDEDEDEDEDEE